MTNVSERAGGRPAMVGHPLVFSLVGTVYFGLLALAASTWEASCSAAPIVGNQPNRQPLRDAPTLKPYHQIMGIFSKSGDTICSSTPSATSPAKSTTCGTAA